MSGVKGLQAHTQALLFGLDKALEFCGGYD
jgi:hypothetical protein